MGDSFGALISNAWVSLLLYVMQIGVYCFLEVFRPQKNLFLSFSKASIVWTLSCLSKNWNLRLGFFFSALGDFALKYEMPHNFEFGIIFFFIAHIFFIEQFQENFFKFSAIIGIYAVGPGLCVFSILTIDEDLFYPVFSYFLILMTMAYCALIQLQRQIVGAKEYCIAFGGFIFFISDAFIGLNKFTNYDIPQCQQIILTLYWIGQVFIFLSSQGNTISQGKTKQA